MQRTPVESSNIASVGYSEEFHVLEVEFHSGAVYQYAFVTPIEHQAMMKAPSIGTHLHNNIKPLFSFRKVHGGDLPGS